MVSFSQNICTDIRIRHSGCVSSSGISLSAALIVSKHDMSVGLTILMFIFQISVYLTYYISFLVFLFMQSLVLYSFMYTWQMYFITFLNTAMC